MPEPARKHSLLLLGVLSAALALKVALLAVGAVSFESDEAVVGLMARHILQGARPVFYYGQAYMGSLDAWLVAGLYALFGPSVIAIRVVQTALFLAHVSLTFVLARRYSGDALIALLSALLMAVPPVLLTLYTTVSLGGYGETLVLGDLLLLVGWRLVDDRDAGLRWWVLLGVLAGLGFWTLGLIAAYLLPLGVMLLWRHRRRAWLGTLLASIAFVAGSGLWWAHNLTHSWTGIRSLYDPTAQIGLLVPILPLRLRVLGLFLIGLPALTGMRLPWLSEWLSPLLVPVVAALYGAIAWHALGQARRNAWRGGYRLLGGLGVALLGILVLSRFGSDPTGRYLLPLYTPLCIFVADSAVAMGRARRWWTAIPIVAVVGLNLWGTWVCATSTRGLTPQYDPRLQYGNQHDGALIAFLEDHDGTRGYTNYWISFKIAFLSDEDVILASALPYKAHLSDAGENRYQPYADLVGNSDQVVFVTGFQPGLDTLLREGFAREGIEHREQEIGPYRVFYDLSSRISPAELDVRWQ